MQNKKKLIVILGPTASGKTKFAIELAQYFCTEIISADSRQIYKEIPISTAQPTSEQLAMVKHHLVGFASIRDTYNTVQFTKDAKNILDKIFLKSDYVIICGGTGLYIDALCNGIDTMPDIAPEILNCLNRRFKEEGLQNLVIELKDLDPEYFEVVDKKNPHRIIRALSVCIASQKPYSYFRKEEKVNHPFEIIKIGINPGKEILHSNINIRVEKMFTQGLLEEAQQIYNSDLKNSVNSIGLTEFFSYFSLNCSLAEAKESVCIHTRQYAKRQMTWFKRCDSTFWLDYPDLKKVLHSFS